MANNIVRLGTLVLGAIGVFSQLPAIQYSELINKPLRD